MEEGIERMINRQGRGKSSPRLFWANVDVVVCMRRTTIDPEFFFAPGWP